MKEHITVDGKKIAQELVAEMKQVFAQYKIVPKLAIVTVSSDPVVAQFVRIKKRIAEELGVSVLDIMLPVTSTQAEIIQEISRLATDIAVQGIIVQLPLPRHMDVAAVLAGIPPEKDVDALTENALVPAPVASAVLEILRYHDIKVQGAHTLVIGQGRLVGKPTAELLRANGAVVTVLDRPTENLTEYTKKADIIVLGAGSPGLLTAGMIKDNIVIIDAGTSEQAGKIVGDAHSSCAEKAHLITPVPGGIGPIAVAMIYKNLLELTQQ